MGTLNISNINDVIFCDKCGIVLFKNKVLINIRNEYGDERYGPCPVCKNELIYYGG